MKFSKDIILSGISNKKNMALFGMLVIIILLGFNNRSLTNKNDKLNQAIGEHNLAITSCELDKLELDQKVDELEESIVEYKQSWEDQVQKTKTAQSIIDELNNNTRNIIRNIRNNKPELETCNDSINWMLDNAIGTQNE